MPTLLTPEIAPSAPEPRRKRWTREECAGLEAAGVLDTRRYELIEGDLIDRMGKNSPHVTAVIAITLWLHQVFGALFVRFEGPIDVSPEDNPTNEPQPDIVVLTREFFNFTSTPPRPADLRLVVEVSDSTLYFDLSTKADLYARAGIVEYWVLDINRRRLIVHRNPLAGKHESVMNYGENEPVAPLAAPHAEFRPAQAFPVPAAV
jgi:Uma2 family endonuclease